MLPLPVGKGLILWDPLELHRAHLAVTVLGYDTLATRTLTLDMIMASGANCEYEFNPQTIEITQLATAPPVKYIRFVESTTGVNGSLSSFRVYVEVSGCTLDATRKDLVSHQIIPVNLLALLQHQGPITVSLCTLRRTQPQVPGAQSSPYVSMIRMGTHMLMILKWYKLRIQTPILSRTIPSLALLVELVAAKW